MKPSTDNLEQVAVAQQCRALRLPAVADQCASLAQEAIKQRLTYLRYLEALLATGQEDPRVAGVKILVAEDNLDMREYLRKLLSPPFAIHAVNNGREAMESALSHPPDLILSDAMMPVLDGFEFLRAVRATPELRQIPFIMLSARAREEARIEGLRARVDDYVVKPFSSRELLARVHAQLTLARSRKEASEREQAIRAEAEAERLKLRDMFRVAPAGMLFLKGPEHRIVLANELYVAMVGRESADEIQGKAIREALPEVEGQGYFELLDKVYETGKVILGKEAAVSLGKNALQGKQQYCDFSYQPTFDAFGKVDGILVHVVEVTEKVFARKLIEESENRFRVIADAAPVLIRTSRVPGELEYVNRRWLEFVEGSMEEEIGSGWIRNVHPNDVQRCLSAYSDGFVQRGAFEMEYRLKHHDGEYRSILNRGVPRFRSDGSFEGYIGVGVDVENQRRAEDALRKSEKLSAVGKLASTIAHEINNPLEAVTNLLYLMSQMPVEPEMASYLKTAEEELARVTHIVTHSLKFHRQTAAARAEQISTLLDSTVMVYQGRLRNSKITVQTDYREKAHVECFGSEIRQVFSNLLANTIDASDDGSTITARTRDCRSHRSGQPGVTITIADRGSGMSAKTVARLFEPFYSTKGLSGTGLGLWVSKEILDKHGATVKVRSRQGTHSGTVFSIFLPCTSAQSKISSE
jgi:PAS domain S-box-containing protein